MRKLTNRFGTALAALACAAALWGAVPAVAQASPLEAARSHGGGKANGALLSATASVTGLTQDQVLTQLQAGQSLEQIAQANGRTANDVIQAARTLLQDQLAQKVADGRLTQAEADTKLADFDTNAPQLVSDTTLGQRVGTGCGSGRNDTQDATGASLSGTRRFNRLFGQAAGLAGRFVQTVLTTR